MKILIIASEEWNDYVYSNNVLTNWFTDFNAEFAEIYTSQGMPINNICYKYFQITDWQMLKSIFFLGLAGKSINKENTEDNRINVKSKGIYKLLKQISLYINTPLLLLKDAIWTLGRYNKQEINSFIKEFNPDIVFCPRKISPKLMRLEKYVSTITNAPFVAFTGDDEASMSGKNYSPLYWIRKYLIFKMFEKHIKIYSHYMLHSQDQALEYKNKYGINTSILLKCGNIENTKITKTINSPIVMVYAGRLYCNRWKTLSEIGNALKKINVNNTKIILNIYTQDKLTKKQIRELTEDKFIYIKGSVNSKQLKEIYKKSDIALHVESMDEKNRLATQYSFSTKIVDLLSSTCAVIAICWEKQAGYQYLKNNDSAFCISDYNEIYPLLSKIINNKNLIFEYSEKARQCCLKYHRREIIQRNIIEVFSNVISKNLIHQ